MTLLISTNQLPPVDLADAYFGNEYRLNDDLVIRQPTMDEIIQYGEQSYWQLVNCITIISSDMKSELWDAGKYWGDVPDFELFYLMTRGLSPDKTKILFGDKIDFREFGWYKQTNNDIYCMYNQRTGLKMDELLYAKMFKYVAAIHGIVKKPEFAANEITKKFMIDEDRGKKRKAAKKEYVSTLFPLFSYLSAANKYTLKDLKEMKIFVFLDSVKRNCAVSNANLLLNGIYAGRVDGDKVSKKLLDSTRDLYGK